MKKTVNEFAITGIVNADATLEQHATKTKAVTAITLGTTKKHKDGTTEQVSAPFPVVMWADNAEAAQTFALLKKGALVTVEGFISLETVQGEDGKRRAKTVFVAKTVSEPKEA